jgi:hypothetical protein
MKKFSKIFENKESLLLNIKSTEDEIRDMCSELNDEGYDISIESEYIGTDGHIYYDINETSQYYPCIKVDLYRETSNKDEYGSTNDQKDQFKDVRSWNGSVYYEGDINILKSIYELCYRFESTFTSDEASVYFSIRSINEVTIRITFKIKESESIIDFSKVDRFLSGEALNLNDDYYEIEETYSMGGSKDFNITIEIKANRNNWSARQETIKRMLSSPNHDDIQYLEKIVKDYANRLFEESKKSAKNKIKLVSKRSDQNKDFTYYVMHENKILISIEGNFYTQDEKEIVVSKGIFKDRKEKIIIKNIEMKVKLHY